MNHVTPKPNISPFLNPSSLSLILFTHKHHLKAIEEKTVTAGYNGKDVTNHGNMNYCKGGPEISLNIGYLTCKLVDNITFVAFHDMYLAVCIIGYHWMD